MKTILFRTKRRKLISGVGIACVIAVLVFAIHNAFFVNIMNTHAAGTASTSFRDDFNGTSLNTDLWSASDYAYSQGSIANQHQGYFQPDRVSVSGGYLTIALTQENGQVGTNANGIISRGGEIATNDAYGYGTYEWSMRTSSTASSPTDTTGKAVSGQISSGFNYINNSETELDMEIEGQFPEQAEATTWHNPNPANDPTDADSIETDKTMSHLETSFNTYKIVWSASEVQYYVNDTLVADHTTHVPSTAADFIFNHWGTDSTDFGGPATVGTERYLLVDWFQYTAA